MCHIFIELFFFYVVRDYICIIHGCSGYPKQGLTQRKDENIWEKTGGFAAKHHVLKTLIYKRPKELKEA